MIYSWNGIAPHGLGEAGFVAPTAVLIGDVRLGRDAVVLWGAVLRGDNEPITLGAGSNVQDGCVLHTDPGFPLVIGDAVTVGHGAILHGCTIGDGALIGMGAVVLNGARVGRHCLIGARALVGEGKIIPDNSVVLGVPGRVTGEVTEDQRARMREGAANYVALGRRARGALVALPAEGG